MNASLPSAEELAAAVRDGLDARRFFRPLPPAKVPYPSDETMPRLTFYRRPVDHPVPPSRFWGGWAVRSARKAAKWLLGPWLEHQTEFNEAVLAEVQLLNRYLRETADRLTAVQGEVIPTALTTNARLGECLYELHRLADEVRGPGATAVVGFGEGVPHDPPHVAVGLFTLTRIGRPPGRVLVLGPGGWHALDLAGLGFQVVLHTSAPAVPSHPDLQVIHAGREAGLPFPDASFDCVLVPSGDGDAWADAASPMWAEVARVLRPDGRVIGSWAGAVSPGKVGPLTVREVRYARRAGHGWAFDSHVSDAADLTLWVGEGGR